MIEKHIDTWNDPPTIFILHPQFIYFCTNIGLNCKSMCDSTRLFSLATLCAQCCTHCSSFLVRSMSTFSLSFYICWTYLSRFDTGLAKTSLHCVSSVSAVEIATSLCSDIGSSKNPPDIPPPSHQGKLLLCCWMNM